MCVKTCLVAAAQAKDHLGLIEDSIDKTNKSRIGETIMRKANNANTKVFVQEHECVQNSRFLGGDKSEYFSGGGLGGEALLFEAGEARDTQ